MSTVSTLQTCHFSGPKGPSIEVRAIWGERTASLPASAASSANGLLCDLERDLILRRLAMLDGHRARTAQSLGIGVRTLGMKLKSWGVTGRQNR